MITLWRILILVVVLVSDQAATYLAALLANVNWTLKLVWTHTMNTLKNQRIGSVIWKTDIGLWSCNLILHRNQWEKIRMNLQTRPSISEVMRREWGLSYREMDRDRPETLTTTTTWRFSTTFWAKEISTSMNPAFCTWTTKSTTEHVEPHVDWWCTIKKTIMADMSTHTALVSS